MEHGLKTWPGLFHAIKTGAKNFEVRKNDRGFQTGDILVLRKFDPTEIFDGRVVGYDLDEPPLRMRVAYMLCGFGIENGYVVMGIEPVDTTEGSSEQNTALKIAKKLRSTSGKFQMAREAVAQWIEEGGWK